MILSARVRKAVSVLSLLAFAAGQLRADTFTVTSNGGGVGSNTLGAAVNGADAGSGASLRPDTINITLGSPQTIVLDPGYPGLFKAGGVTTTMSASSLVTVDAGASSGFAVNGGVLDTSNVLFAGSGSLALALGVSTLAVDQDVLAHLYMNLGTLRTKASATVSGSVVSANGTFDVQGAGNTTTLSGAIDGIGLIKTGAGVLRLTNAANAHGTTTVNAGTLSIANDAVLGTGGLTLGSATLLATGDLTSSRAIAATGNAVIDATGHAASFSGNVSGAGGITVVGGNVSLTGSNGSTGGTTIAGGGTILSVDSDDALGSSVSGMTINSGTLRALGDITAIRNIGLASGGTIDTNGHQIALSGAVSTVAGSGGLVKMGAGTLTLSGPNTYTGGTTVAGGTVSVGADAGLGNASGGVTLNGGGLQFTGSFTTSRGLTLGGGAGVDVAASQSAALSGVVGGAGGLTKTGAGTLALSNTNTYTGGTAVNGGVLAVSGDGNLGGAGGLSLSAGTLRALADMSSTRDVSLSGGGAVDTNGHNVALSGAFGGTGGLAVSGEGVLTLSGVNTYAGGTTVSSTGLITTLAIDDDRNLGATSGGLVLNTSGLQTDAGVTSGRNISLLGNGGVIYTQGNNSLFSGTISGPGDFVVVGTGTVALTGTNTYGGLTVADAGGTLSVGSDANMGAGGGILLSAGTLRASGSFSSVRGVDIDALGTLDTNGHDLALSGAVSGDELIKTGAGTLTSSGVNTYTGGTQVLGGTLRMGRSRGTPSGDLTVASGAVFDMTGANQLVDAVANAGTIRTGGAGLQAAGYAGSGTLAVTLISNVSPNLSAVGVNAAGGTLLIEGRPVSGDYLVVHTFATSINPFATIVAPAHKRITPTYTANDLFLNVLTLSSLNRPGLGRNQAVVAARLDASAATSSGDLDSALGNLNDLSPARQVAALTQASGVSSFGAMSGMSFSGSRAHAGAVERRASALRAQAASVPAVFQVADVPGDAPAAYFSGDKWGVFASALGGAGKQKSLDGGNQPGYDLSSSGVTVGIDRRLTENLSVGASFGCLGATADIAGDGGSVKDASIRYGLYGVGNREKWFGTLSLGAASDGFDTARRIAALGQTASASPHGKEVNVDLQGGYQWKPALAFLAGLSHDSLSIDGYREAGAGPMDLTVGGQTADSLRMNLGVKTGKKIQKSPVAYTPTAALSLLHEFKDQGRSVNADLASVGAFQTKTADVSRTGALVSLGVTAAWAKGFSANASYNGEFRSGFSNHTVSGGLRKAF